MLAASNFSTFTQWAVSTQPPSSTGFHKQWPSPHSENQPLLEHEEQKHSYCCTSNLSLGDCNWLLRNNFWKGWLASSKPFYILFHCDESQIQSVFNHREILEPFLSPWYVHMFLDRSSGWFSQVQLSILLIRQHGLSSKKKVDKILEIYNGPSIKTLLLQKKLADIGTEWYGWSLKFSTTPS